MTSSRQSVERYIATVVRLTALILLILSAARVSLADYQRLAISPRERAINVSSKAVEVEAYCLDRDLDPPPISTRDIARLTRQNPSEGGQIPSNLPTGPVPYPALITPDAECVYVGRSQKPITVKEAMEKFGLTVEGISRFGLASDEFGLPTEAFNLRFRSRVPLRIDLHERPLAFSHTKGSVDDPNTIETELFEFLKTITSDLSHRHYQRELWRRGELLSLLRNADYWEGPKDYVTTKRRRTAEQRAKEDLRVRPDQSLADELRKISLDKSVPNREQHIEERKRRTRVRNLNLLDIQIARSSSLSASEYLRNPTNSPSLVNYEKRGSEELFIHLNSFGTDSSSPDSVSVTVLRNNKPETSYVGVQQFQSSEIKEVAQATHDQQGSFAIYGTRSRDGGAMLFIRNRFVFLTRQELEAFQDGNPSPQLKLAMQNLKGVNDKKPQGFIIRSLLYQGRLGDLSKTGKPSPILDQWFVNPNDLMTWFSNAFKNQINFWLTNDILEGMNNVARLPGISQGSQVGIFKGGVLDPQGDIAAVESDLKKNYNVQFVTKGKNKPSDVDLVVFFAHNDGRDGDFERILNDAIRKGLLENRIVLLGICGTGNEADLASRAIREGNARLVIYFDKKISSGALTKVTTSFIKVASSTEWDPSDLPPVWHSVVKRVAAEADIGSQDPQQIMLLGNPRFLVLRLGEGRNEMWYVGAQKTPVEAR